MSKNSAIPSSRQRRRRSRRGAMLILIVVTLIVLIIGAMFSVDVAFMHVTRAELRTATDAAARAGAGTLARTQNRARAISTAQEYAFKNEVAGRGLSVLANQVELGGIRSSGNKLLFEPRSNKVLAVRVNGARDKSSIDGPVPLFFGPALGINNFSPTTNATGAANVRDIALVVDVSLSMELPIGRLTRLRALQNSVNLFLDELNRSSPMSQVSLSAYSTFAARIEPLTPDLARIRARVATLFPLGFTAIGLGLEAGVHSLLEDPLSRPFAVKTVIVMTDGQHNVGPSPLQTVQQAVAAEQTVHTITFGPEANQQLMKQVAEATEGGLHFHANDAADLTAAFQTIAKRLSVILVE